MWHLDPNTYGTLQFQKLATTDFSFICAHFHPFSGQKVLLRKEGHQDSESPENNCVKKYIFINFFYFLAYYAIVTFKIA